MEETGEKILSIVKQIHIKDMWQGRNGITEKGSSVWIGMRNIMNSHRKYS